MNKYGGRDVFVIVPTGSGKSTVILAPLLAALELGETKQAIVIVPTKALAQDHLDSATRAGIKAVAINEDTIREAASRGEDLYSEFAKGTYQLAVIVPEQLQTEDFARLIKNPDFLAALTFVDIDEVHIWDTWGQDFRKKAYAAVSNLRHRLPRTVVYTALTATLIPGESEQRVMEGLGFRQKNQCKDDFELFRLPVDRPTLKYTARFLTHGLGGTSFPDLYWLISLLRRNSVHHQKVIISCGTIDLATRLMDWLESMLPLEFANRRTVIQPYHSLLGSEARVEILRKFEGPDSEVQAITSTDCLGCGINSDAPLAVLLKFEPTFEGMVQWMGRAGRHGPGNSIAYGPPWLREETDEEINGDRGRGGPGMSLKVLEERRAKRAAISQDFVRFFNPTTDMCSRAALSNAFKEPYVRPTDSPCCDFCNPDTFHADESERFAESLLSAKITQPSLRSDGTYAALSTSGMRSEAHAALVQWRTDRWMAWPKSKSILPPSTFIYDHLLDTLCSKLHVITTYERFAIVLKDWAQLAEYGEELYAFALALIKRLDAAYKAKKATMSVDTGDAEMTSSSALTVDTVADRPIPQLREKNTAASATRTTVKHPLSPQKPKPKKRSRVDKEQIPPPPASMGMETRASRNRKAAT